MKIKLKIVSNEKKEKKKNNAIQTFITGAYPCRSSEIGLKFNVNLDISGQLKIQN